MVTNPIWFMENDGNRVIHLLRFQILFNRVKKYFQNKYPSIDFKPVAETSQRSLKIVMDPEDEILWRIEYGICYHYILISENQTILWPLKGDELRHLPISFTEDDEKELERLVENIFDSLG